MTDRTNELQIMAELGFVTMVIAEFNDVPAEVIAKAHALISKVAEMYPNLADFSAEDVVNYIYNKYLDKD